jgi:hypothetical protein
VALISAGCSNTGAETGSGSSGGNNTAATHEKGTEKSWIKLGYSRNLVIKDRRAVGDGISLAKRATVLTAKDFDG